uniref:signal peptidase II n=1 Tax=Nitrospira cf. moscoviensis SBR1015 TaxID=96242 RepID=UPI000B3BBD1A|nr:signal peptidase II [Nitrospira cf. moscoviensis SBR1015]
MDSSADAPAVNGVGEISCGAGCGRRRISAMDKLKRSAMLVLLLLSCVGCDQITKDAARNYLVSEAPISWFHDTIRLEYAENAGAFLSFGAGFSEQQRVILFQALPALALAGLTMVLVVSNGLSTIAIIAWSLVLSGGAGTYSIECFTMGESSTS